ncbi:MAG: hypothetical protein KDJ38_09755 [Gammaproteobacteria bacterium]|nr:hypothetical protein [Gammaproteobacteria bacterium]
MDKSIEQLENSKWPDQEHASSMMERCLKLRKLPISSLSPADLRLLIGQKIGVLYIVPIAIELLQSDPMLQADYYRGDLLACVLDLPESFWSENIELHNMMVEVKIEAEIMLETMRDELLPKLSRFDFRGQL